MKPEQRVAARVVKRYKLTTPVDVEGLAAILADVEQDVLPVNSDAVVITAGMSQRRPRIILNSSTPRTRRRFTLAHEIGHLLIPWHMGTFACHPLGGIRLGDHLYSTTEAESNRFASELLLPSEWLKGIANAGMSAGHMLKFIRSAAEVSTAAAVLAQCQVLAAGYVFATTDENGFVVMSGSSPGSVIQAPAKGVQLNLELYSKRALKYETISSSSNNVVHWWRYGPVSLAASANDQRNSTEIIRAIIASVVYTPQQAQILLQSINGIIGAANGSRRPKKAEELLGILFETFATRPQLVQITSHSDFDTFLRKRTMEIISRNQLG